MVESRLENGSATNILEIGFGLGLNCLLTLDLAITNQCPVNYVGVEHQPIDADTFKSLKFDRWLQHPKLFDALCGIFKKMESASLAESQRVTMQTSSGATPASSDNKFSYVWSTENSMELSVHVTDATTFVSATNHLFDAIYLDAFSPDVNPECWSDEFIAQLKRCLKPGGYLATYCVKGALRRSLARSGWDVQKFPGPNGKREVLRATYSH